MGGVNAFHFLTFVVGLATLVVNVENNLNQNNNNLNGINVNSNKQTNNNANANNNAMNMIEVKYFGSLGWPGWVCVSREILKKLANHKEP